MSLELKVYTNKVSDNLIPKIVSRLNTFEMICEIYPGFSFDNQTGYLPFKFQLTNPPFPILKDKILTSGFELYCEVFDIEQEKQKRKPKQGFIEKLLGKKQLDEPFTNAAIDKKIKKFNRVISFVWHTGDSFELRFASLTSAIVTELTNGVCCYPADDIWYDNKNFVEKTWQDVKEYEMTLLKEQNLKFHEFEKW